jgi:hypothetical protein
MTEPNSNELSLEVRSEFTSTNATPNCQPPSFIYRGELRFIFAFCINLKQRRQTSPLSALATAAQNPHAMVSGQHTEDQLRALTGNAFRLKLIVDRLGGHFLGVNAIALHEFAHLIYAFARFASPVPTSALGASLEIPRAPLPHPYWLGFMLCGDGVLTFRGCALQRG